jgi:exodeoxyribonuclease VII small subunit
MADETAKPANNSDIAKMSFEEALAELQQIVQRLEQGDAKLDDAIKAYERGAELKKHCEQKLEEAKQKVAVIAKNPDGSVSARGAGRED